MRIICVNQILCFLTVGCLRLFLPEVNVYAYDVTPSSRLDSLTFYRDVYVPGGGIDLGWTGNYGTCDAGQTSQEFRDAVIDRVNYFRAMAGVPSEVTLTPSLNEMAQQAALMMSANNSVNHNPPASWHCYTAEGALAASKSNLAFGANGVTAIDFYMQEPGPLNASAGHRRWMLYPGTDEMGTGDVPRIAPNLAANSLWVIDSSPVVPTPVTREPFVAWPPPGYVPYRVTYPRWSFTLEGANFSSATVTMTEDGAVISAAKESISQGFGDNSLVWIPKGLSSLAQWPRPTEDVVYDITIDNVIVGGVARSFAYQVTVFDPNLLLADFDGDGEVAGADLAVWKDHFGSTNAIAADGDADRDLDVDGTDFLYWQRERAVSVAISSAIAVPEPTGAMVHALVAGGIYWACRDAPLHRSRRSRNKVREGLLLSRTRGGSRVP